MATNLHDNWVRNGWQERLDQLLDLLTDYDILLIEAQAGFGKRRTIERWHHLLAGSGKTIFRLDCDAADMAGDFPGASARGRSEEHTSELQSLMRISYAGFCLKKKSNYIQKDDVNTEYTKQNTATK